MPGLCRFCQVFARGAPGRGPVEEVGGFARDMAWTDNRLLILGLAESFDVTQEVLGQWWLDESGPIG